MGAGGLLMLRPSPATAMAAMDMDTAVVDMVVMAVATMATARGLLMLSPRLMLLLRLSPAMATTAAVVMEAMVATDTAVATTAMARGRLRLSPATATAVDTAAMVVTAATAMVATAGATATAR